MNRIIFNTLSLLHTIITQKSTSLETSFNFIDENFWINHITLKRNDLGIDLSSNSQLSKLVEEFWINHIDDDGLLSENSLNNLNSIINVDKNGLSVSNHYIIYDSLEKKQDSLSQLNNTLSNIQNIIQKHGYEDGISYQNEYKFFEDRITLEEIFQLDTLELKKIFKEDYNTLTLLENEINNIVISEYNKVDGCFMNLYLNIDFNMNEENKIENHSYIDKVEYVENEKNEINEPVKLPINAIDLADYFLAPLSIKKSKEILKFFDYTDKNIIDKCESLILDDKKDEYSTIEQFAIMHIAYRDQYIRELIDHNQSKNDFLYNLHDVFSHKKLKEYGVFSILSKNIEMTPDNFFRIYHPSLTDFEHKGKIYLPQDFNLECHFSACDDLKEIKKSYNESFSRLIEESCYEDIDSLSQFNDFFQKEIKLELKNNFKDFSDLISLKKEKVLSEIAVKDYDNKMNMDFL